MKKLAFLALTPGGARLGLKICKAGVPEPFLYLPQRLVEEEGILDPAVTPYREPLALLVKKLWQEYEGLVFLMATGIVVRTIAPYLKHKLEDPAIVVLDEAGRFAISLLSGHWGGGNKLSQELAGLLGATPVITTATDVQNVPALDLWARERDLVVEPINKLKSYNMQLLAGKKCTLWHEPYLALAEGEYEQFEFKKLPFKPQANEEGSLHAFVTPELKDEELPQEAIFLRPKLFSVGIGCKRGTTAEAIYTSIKEIFQEYGLSLGAIKHLATIDLKADEGGIWGAAQLLQRPVQIVTREAIQDFSKERKLTTSSFVLEKIGVVGVAEPAALLTLEEGELLCPKTKQKGLTVAIAREKSTLLAQVQETWLT